MDQKIKTLLQDNILSRIIVIDNETDAQIEREEREQQLKKKWGNCGLGPKYLNCSFNNFEQQNEEQKELFKKAQLFINNTLKGEPSNLVLVGPPGTGKTHIAAASLYNIGWQVKERNYKMTFYYSTHYITSASLFYEIENTFHAMRAVNTDFVLDYLSETDVLAIDEIGTMPGMNESRILFDLIDRRYRENKSTILCSNLHYSELKMVLGAPTLSRLQENGRMIKVETFNTPDFRIRHCERSAK